MIANFVSGNPVAALSIAVVWAGLRGPRYWLQLDRTAHLSFTDLQVLLGSLTGKTMVGEGAEQVSVSGLVDPGLRESLVEQPAGRSDERRALSIFLVPRLLPDKN